MIDLTPLDVRKKRGDFRPKLRGYDPEEVDTFLEVVADRFEELVKENLELSERVERSGSQLKALEERESAVQEALVSAQKLREEVSSQTQRDADLLKEQARRESVILKAEAETEIGRRLGEAEGLIRERRWALEELDRNRRKFLKGFRSLLEREMEALEVEEARRPLEETPLDLDLRGWAFSGEAEEVEEDEEAGEEEREPKPEFEPELEAEPGGFETQRLDVPIPADRVDEAESAVAEVSDDVEAEEETVRGSREEMEAEAMADLHGDPALDVPSDEMAQDEADVYEKYVFEEEEPASEDASDELADEALTALGVDPDFGEEEDEDEEKEETGAAPWGDTPGGPAPSGGTEEPKWLFSLLKREEGEVPSVEAEDESEEEV
jgi:DivIVA domain-containing protein